MSDQPDTKNSNVGAKRTILRVMVPVILFIAGLLLLVNPILNTPFVSDRISRFLSDTLHQPAAVRGIRLSGGSILINGLDIMNPPGFPPGKVIAVGYLEISPEWRSLMAGMRAFTSIRVHGLRLSLDKKGDGTWNFTGLTSLLRGKKGGAEVFIRSLLLEEGSISVAGRGVRDISLAVSDLSSKGSTTSRILLTFSDDYGDRLRVAGKGRAGVKPEFDMELSAPLCSFRWLRGSGLPIDPEKGRWKLKLDAALHDGELKINGKAAVNSLSLKISGEESIHGGSLAFAGHYGLNRDTAVVDSCILELDGALRLHATGKIEQLRRERLYSIVIEQEGFRLEDVFRLFPPGVRRDLHPRGEVLPAAFRLSGSSGNGIAAASGEVSIRGMGLSSGKRLILESLQADARIAGGRGGWELTGKVSQPKPSAGSLLRFSDTPFKLSMDGRFRPIRGECALAATFAGDPLRGSFLYRNSDPEPISGHLELAHGSLEELSRSIPLKGTVVTKGMVDAYINARGSLTGGLRCDAATTVSGLQGKFGDRKIVLGKLTADASGLRNSGGFSASGRVAASSGEMDA
ncbi:MAG TPA: hypothetical protein VMC44_01920, partial [Geobacteraceae bacterium]|nr:hypothetical protein [Geobacteraceae bacterium]